MDDLYILFQKVPRRLMCVVSVEGHRRIFSRTQRKLIVVGKRFKRVGHLLKESVGLADHLVNGDITPKPITRFQ